MPRELTMSKYDVMLEILENQGHTAKWVEVQVKIAKARGVHSMCDFLTFLYMGGNITAV
jgi:hypothetical protein